MEEIALDTYVFLDLFSGDSRFEGKVKTYMEKVMEGKIKAVISSGVFSELFYHVAKKWGVEKAEERIAFITSYPNLTITPVNNEISILAGRLRYKYYRKPPQREISYLDCIHLATAIFTNCKKFVTGDKDFEDIEEIDIEVY